MSITLDLPDEISADLLRRAQQAGLTPGVFVAEALRRQLAIEQFRETREALSGYSKRAGLETDEDVFAAIS
jgi:hypothetical protein